MFWSQGDAKSTLSIGVGVGAAHKAFILIINAIF
jgi:hypothetical protein